MNEEQKVPGSVPPAALTDNTASRAKRLAAALIDIFLVSFFVQPFIDKHIQEQVVKNPFDVPPEIAVKVLMYEVLVFFALNLVFLFVNGQTIGKRLMNIAIRDLQNQKPNFVGLIMNRYLIQIPMMIIPLLNLVDVSFILIRKDRRCIHDLIAKTKVVDLRIQVLPTPNSLIA